MRGGNVGPGTRSKWAPQARGLGLHHEPAPSLAAAQRQLVDRGLARRLHRIHCVGPFLRKLCPAGQALVGKEEEAAAFQNLVGWGAEVGQDVKAPKGFSFFPPCFPRLLHWTQLAPVSSFSGIISDNLIPPRSPFTCFPGAPLLSPGTGFLQVSNLPGFGLYLHL